MSLTDKIQLSKNIATISGVFCILVSILLLLNYYQFSRIEPLESKTIEALVEKLQENPNSDELKEEIRDYDLLARKAYFNTQWQVKTGAYILLVGAVVFAIALRFYYSLKAKIEKPVQQSGDEITSRILSQKWILVTGSTIMVLAFAISFATVDHLKVYSLSEDSTQQEGVPDDGIEVVDVGPQAQSEAAPSQQETRVGENGAQDEGFSSSEDIVQEETMQVKDNQEETGEVQAPAHLPASVTAQGALTATLVEANYNSFRGPWGRGVSKISNTPVEWDGASGTNMLWKATIPKLGYNSPVIWEDKIFLSGGDGEAREVYCYDKNSGKLLWAKKADNIPGSPATMPRVSEDTGLAAPTLTTDGKRVFAIFATGDIICFNMEGNRLWDRNLGVPDNHYGHSSSLITWNGKIFIQYDTNKGGKVMALNSASGETVWETQRNAHISWASPVLAEINGKMQVVLTADPIVAGYDAETGQELWAVECMMGEVGPSVAVGEGFVFAANEYARLAAINPADGSIVWEDDYYLPEVASPVCANGLLIVATSYGMLVCYDAKTGEMLWEHDVGTGFYASPVVAGNKIYALDTDGVMHILELSREVKVVAEPELGEDGFASPAFSEGKIFIRGAGTLYCFGK